MQGRCNTLSCLHKAAWPPQAQQLCDATRLASPTSLTAPCLHPDSTCLHPAWHSLVKSLHQSAMHVLNDLVKVATGWRQWYPVVLHDANARQIGIMDAAHRGTWAACDMLVTFTQPDIAFNLSPSKEASQPASQPATCRGLSKDHSAPSANGELGLPLRCS